VERSSDSGIQSCKRISEYEDSESRFIFVTGKIEGTCDESLCVYAPTGGGWSFYIFKPMITKSHRVLICSGDFNIRLNSKRFPYMEKQILIILVKG